MCTLQVCHFIDDCELEQIDTNLQGIPQMEPLVMEAMSWAARPTVDSVHPQEPSVLACREQIKSALTAALQPVHDFLAKLQVYNSWLLIDPVAYVEALQASHLSPVPTPVCHVSVVNKPLLLIAAVKYEQQLLKMCARC